MQPTKQAAHKASKQLIDENQVIIAENLAVKNMLKNHCLAKSISDAGWGELIRQIEYKAKWYCRTFVQVGTFFPSSKTCNGCKFVLDKLPLSVRQWTCPNCSQENDRDLNAARNIRDQGVISSMSGQGTVSDTKQKLAEAPASKAGLRNKRPRP